MSLIIFYFSDSPVLWIRLDPEMIILRSVIIEQPDFQWQFQLRHERDVTAQFEAIVALKKYATPATRLALTDTIENNNCFYKVRCKAAHCLKEVYFILIHSIKTELFFFLNIYLDNLLGCKCNGDELDWTSSNATNISKVFWFIQRTTYHQTE